MAREEGVEEVVVGLTYSISPVHTDAYYVERARGRGRVPRHRPALPEGPRRAADRRPVRELAPAFVARSRRGRWSSTATARSGSRRSAYVEGRAARDHARSTPRSRRWRTARPTRRRDHAAQPRGRGLLARPRRRGARRHVSRHFRALARMKGLPLGAPAEYDAAYYHHQMPGGMVTTMRRQLDELRRPELFDADARGGHGRVREEMGWPIMVTPLSQFVGTQAVMNIISGERWAHGVRRDGALLPGPLRRAARAAGPGGERPRAVEPRAAELRHLEPLALEGARGASGRGSPTRSCCCG